ncbi:MAG: ABC transporter ATP-binding protein [Lachnospiraceae bacterium]|nr:ABC transporter ATP-binding protein [Lachnospiraceae bacterium]
MLTLSHISKKYGKFSALEDINIELDNGLYGVLAPNGAGKTTMIKMITTLLFPSEGIITYDGVDIMEMGEKYRDLIGYLPQQFGYYKNNTPVQYLSYLASLKGIKKEEAAKKVNDLLGMVGLSDVKNKKMKKFSGGMIQRVGIAQAMLNNPKILVLDEPTAGLDPKERVRFRNIISALSKDRIVILSTHIVSDIESIANKVIMIKDKRLYSMDTVDNICERLDGKVFERDIEETEYETFEREYYVLSARQERGHLHVRYYDDKGETGDNSAFKSEKAIECLPNLEDVFLVVYQSDEDTVSTSDDIKHCI